MLGFEIIDSGFVPALLIALVAGMFSFLSPCVLPIVPPYIAYMSGQSFADLASGRPKASLIQPAISFVFGLSTVFVFLGFTASSLAVLFLQNQILFGRIAGVAIIFFGLHFLGVFRIPLLDREARFNVKTNTGSIMGAYILGLAFAFGWVPCIGPQLGAILSLAAQADSVARGTTLLGVYAAGLGIPFVLAAVFIGRSISVMNRLKKHMRLIEVATGTLLLVVGLLMLTGQFSIIAYFLLEKLPFLAGVG